MVSNMLSFLQLPKESILRQFIPKQQFYEHGNFNTRERDLFVRGIERITLYAQLKTDNTNIPAYKDGTRSYEEVAILMVELKENKNLDKLAEMIMSLIPYPMILVFEDKKMFSFYGAHQRDNLQDSAKVILERVYQTSFISKEEESIKEFSYIGWAKQTFYTFYEDYIQSIISYNLKIRNIKEAEDNNRLLEEITRIEEEITGLRNQFKREKQFNRKMDINMEIKKLEAKLIEMEE